jgi:hypothetical protein
MRPAVLGHDRVGGDEAQRLVRRGRVDQLSLRMKLQQQHFAAGARGPGRLEPPPFKSAITDPLG